MFGSVSTILLMTTSHRKKERKMTVMFNYLVVGLAITKDEINGALDEAVLPVMTASLVIQSVLRAVE